MMNSPMPITATTSGTCGAGASHPTARALRSLPRISSPNILSPHQSRKPAEAGKGCTAGIHRYYRCGSLCLSANAAQQRTHDQFGVHRRLSGHGSSSDCSGARAGGAPNVWRHGSRASCKTVGRHYAGPTWEIDGSSIVGKGAGRAPGATAKDIPWLKLNVSDRHGDGPLKEVVTVQRINTAGGNLEGACEKGGELRAEPYAADYLFLRKSLQ